MDRDERDELARLADEMEWDGMPGAARWLHRIAEPSMMEEWRAVEVRKCFV